MEQKSDDRGKWAVISSALTLLICFISSYAFYQYMVAWFARSFDYSVRYTFNEVYVPKDYSLWSAWKVTQLDLFPAAICFILGMVIFWKMKSQSENWGRFQLPGFWMMVCLVNIPLSQLLYAPFGVEDIHSVFYYGLAPVAVWYRIPLPIQLMFAMVGLSFMIFCGVYLCKQVLKLSHSYSFIEKRPGKNRMILRMYVLPVLLVFVPILMLGEDIKGIRLAVALIGLLIPVLGMFIKTSLANFQVRFQKAGIGNYFPWTALIVATALWTFVLVWL